MTGLAIIHLRYKEVHLSSIIMINLKMKNPCLGQDPFLVEDGVKYGGKPSMNCPVGVFLVITSFLPFKTKVTSVGATSKIIRKAIQNSALATNDELVDFSKVCNVYDKISNNA